MTISEELGKLGELHQRGVLTDEEFARAKSRLMGQGGSALDVTRRLKRRSLPVSTRCGAASVDRWIGGVCGGLRRHRAGVLGLRLLIAALTLFGGFGVLVYLLLWIFVPRNE